MVYYPKYSAARLLEKVMPVGKKRTVTIFISYAREDAVLATALQDELLRVFPFGVDVIVDTRSIKPGEDFRLVLDKKLDSSDILLILFTEQPKASHSYTGYEVGYFSRSRAQNRFITKTIERAIIPFCIGRQFPNTAEYLEGVEIDPSDVFRLVEDPASFRGPRAVPLGDDNVVLKLLSRIGEIVTSVTGLGAYQAALRTNIRDSAQRLYQSIFSYLQSRIYSEGFPERKIILRPGQFPPGTNEDEILSNATIELVGQSFELFGVLDTATRVFTLPEFVSHIHPSELASAWNEGIRHLALAALKGDYGDNYHVVSSPKRDKAFRMFVSRVVKYYSGQTEIHIYIVEMITRSYGDEETTRLLQAVSVGLKFRFLVLEKESPFTCENLSYPTVTMRSMITEFLSQMDLILKESRDARLEDPLLLKRIFGAAGPIVVQKNMDTWKDASSQLYTAAHTLLQASDPDAATVKTDFLKHLSHFVECTKAMNQEFTTKALDALAEEIRR
jgi:TIR domain-containing protein